MIFRLAKFHFFFIATFLVSCQTSNYLGQFPVQDAFEKKQAEIHPGRFYPDFDAPPILHNSLNPLITDQSDELVPVPDQVKNIPANVNFMESYKQLLSLETRDSVRSQIFDPNEFSQIKKITVEPFQNKTIGPNRDVSAGRIVTSQVYQELRDSRNYTVIDPFPSEDILLEAIGVTTGPKSIPQVTESSKQKNDLSEFSGPGKEAIMTGAVTKFVDTYSNRHGNQRKSIASGVAFAAYLVTPEGKVIWGARFIGSQRQSFSDFIKYKGRWLSKEEFSKTAMKEVLKDFYKNRPSMK